LNPKVEVADARVEGSDTKVQVADAKVKVWDAKVEVVHPKPVPVESNPEPWNLKVEPTNLRTEDLFPKLQPANPPGQLSKPNLQPAIFTAHSSDCNPASGHSRMVRRIVGVRRPSSWTRWAKQFYFVPAGFGCKISSMAWP
jgi:hypothetical protein